jgi:hypothetical protein
MIAPARSLSSASPASAAAPAAPTFQLKLYGAGPWAPFLAETLGPFIEAAFGDRRLASFHYYSSFCYCEGHGRHLRLRFRPLDPDFEPDAERFVAARAPNGHCLEHYVWGRDEYPGAVRDHVREPDMSRFRTAEGLAIAEDQYCLSSRTVMALCREHAADWSTKRKVGVALALHTLMARALELPVGAAAELFADSYDVALEYIAGHELRKHAPYEAARATLERACATSYAAQADAVQRVVDAAWSGRLGGRTPVLETWQREHAALGARLRAAGLDPLRTETDDVTHRWKIVDSFLDRTGNRLGLGMIDDLYQQHALAQAFARLARDGA